MKHINETEWNAYLAESCTPERLAWINEHVKICPQCGLKMQSLHDLKDRLGMWEINTDNHDVSDRITQDLLNDSFKLHRSRSLRFVSYALRIAASVLIGIALGYLAGKQNAQQYVARQESTVDEMKPSYLAAIDLQFASGLAWSVLSETPLESEEQK